MPPYLSPPGATLASEMDGAIWTALGLLAATSLGSLFYLGSRIDWLGSRMDALSTRIDALGSRLDARIDALDGKVDAGFARVETRLDAHLEQHAN
jgi:hypothetical protein